MDESGSMKNKDETESTRWQKIENANIKRISKKKRKIVVTANKLKQCSNIDQSS